ncbi:AAA family ATPase [Virgibacillus sp. 6R]|uniref:AAA family ATPase n=1 Tax=Metabacillus sp. 22489 TaxID=3453928 RepID=UPI0011A07901
MNFILLFGPQAVGKMTVGQELEKRTGYKLFHNHMTIELLHPFFGFGDEMWRISDVIREEIFKSASKIQLDGLIFTYVWAFNMQEDWDFVEKTSRIFEENGDNVYFVELEADLNVRLERNQTPNRLAHKPTKRNIFQSETELKNSMENYRLNSSVGEIKRKNYLRINNTHMTSQEVATRIQETFHFTSK